MFFPFGSAFPGKAGIIRDRGAASKFRKNKTAAKRSGLGRLSKNRIGSLCAVIFGKHVCLPYGVIAKL